MYICINIHTDILHTYKHARTYTHKHENDLYYTGSHIEPEKIAKLCLIVLAALYACYALYGGCVLVKVI